MDKRIICKVWKNKSNGQKLVTIPKNCEIEEGGYVEILQLNFPNLKSQGNANKQHV
jgi:hypothetical protein